jgi:HlyD family secretion protein
VLEPLNLVGAEDRPGRERRLAESIRWGIGAIGIRRKVPVIAGVIAMLLALAGTISWVGHQSAPVKYVTAPVTRGVVARTVTATGTVNPVLTIIIGSYVSGVISDMYCDYNTRVKKGQLCAKIDPRPYQAALDQAKGQLARDSAQLAGARINLARYATLQKEDSIAAQIYDDEAALVRQLEGTVQLDQAAVETATVNLAYTKITSPVDGTVVARNITIGQTVAASFQTPTLFLIATDLTKLQVDTNVSESDIGPIMKGNEARFTVEAFGDRFFQGSVVQVRQAPQTVQNVVTYDVVVGADNAELLLKPGMTATVAIVTARRANVLRVPDQALRFTPGGAAAVKPGSPGAGAAASLGPGAARQAQVWILRGGNPVAVTIGTGLDDDTYTEVVTGPLSADDPVIIGEQRAGSSSRTGTFRFGL